MIVRKMSWIVMRCVNLNWLLSKFLNRKPLLIIIRLSFETAVDSQKQIADIESTAGWRWNVKQQLIIKRRKLWRCQFMVITSLLSKVHEHFEVFCCRRSVQGKTEPGTSRKRKSVWTFVLLLLQQASRDKNDKNLEQCYAKEGNLNFVTKNV